MASQARAPEQDEELHGAFRGAVAGPSTASEGHAAVRLLASDGAIESSPLDGARRSRVRQIARRVVFPATLMVAVGPAAYLISFRGLPYQGGALVPFMVLFSLWPLVVATALERLLPLRRLSFEPGEVRTDVAYGVLRHLDIKRFLVAPLLLLLYTPFHGLLQPLVAIPWDAMLPYLPKVLLACVVAEFPDYWAHRFLHSNAFLWRAHAAHHSSRKLYALMTIRAHPIDFLFKDACYGYFLFALGFGAESILFWFLLRSTCGYLSHSNIDYENRWLGYVFNTNHAHRFHHSTDPEECDKNFGVCLMIWDQVFGTFHYPRQGEVPSAYGLVHEGGYPVHGFLKQLAVPFRSMRKAGLGPSATSPAEAS